MATDTTPGNALVRWQSPGDPPPPGGLSPGRTPKGGLVRWVRQAAGYFLGPALSHPTQAPAPAPDAPAPEPHVPDDARSVTSEQAASGPRGITLPWFLPYPDEYTQETPAARFAYRKMLADPNVKSACLGKLFGVASLDLQVIPADKKDPLHQKTAEHVRWALHERLTDGVPGLIWSVILHALVDGYSVCEKVWAYEERGEYAGTYALDALKPKDTMNDVALETDEYRNVVGVVGLRYNAGRVYHPVNFVIHRHQPLFDSPVGMSDFRAAYSRWWMLDTVEKLRAVFLSKRAVPVLKGTFKTWSQKPSLVEALKQAQQANWMAVPEGVLVEALNIAGAADPVYAEAVRDLKHDIFLAIQGAILQALEGEVVEGAGNSQVHRSTADLFRWFLAQCVQSLLNGHKYGLVRDIVDLNYVTDRYPKATLSAVDTNELLRELQIDTGLKQLGLKLSKEKTYERFNREPPEHDADVLDAPQGPAGGGAGGGQAVRAASRRKE